MAGTSLGADSALVTSPNRPPSMPAVARILSRYSRAKLEAFVSVAIDLMDALDGDADTEPTGDDQGDQAWIEWHAMPANQKTGSNILAGPEDSEGDDPEEEDDPSGQCDEDGCNTSWPYVPGPGCPISDSGEQPLQDVTLNNDALNLDGWWLSSGKMPMQGHY